MLSIVSEIDVDIRKMLLLYSLAFAQVQHVRASQVPDEGGVMRDVMRDATRY